MVALSDLLILSRIPHIGPQRLRALISHFPDSAGILEASPRELAAVEGFTRNLASSVAHFRGSSGYREAEEYAGGQISRAASRGCSIVSYWDADYPDLLRRIYDPPPYLFVRGSLKGAARPAIGIVGTRNPSEYGIGAAREFSREFARRGIPSVSGLARGIDTVVHGVTVREGGTTIAVIGSGLDVIYPPENKTLSESIAVSGAVISEYEMGAQPDAMNFPRRNRLISGMTIGTLVVETDVNGGAMITANCALEQNREVFAVPGNIGGKRSRGCNALIREGKAKLVESIDDILVELRARLPADVTDATRARTIAVPELTFFEKHIHDQLSDAPIGIDALAARVGSTTAETLVHLLSLEFKGLARQLPGKRFCKGDG